MRRHLKKIKRHHIIFLVFVSIILVASNFTLNYLELKKRAPEEVEFISEYLDEVFVDSSGNKYVIDPEKIVSGGVPKGGIGVDVGIPALDENNIKFVSVEDANEWISDNELVLYLEYNGEKRIYPLQILVWHEIANDLIGTEKVIVTYCPLCGSGIAYKSEINVGGETKTPKFGTSGKLYNSNLVMYDDLTDTYWQQIGGQAILGELSGQKLIPIDIDTISWRDAKTHADAIVLSQETGMLRDYGRDPYGTYYENSLLFFSVENQSGLIHPKTIIYGIEIEGIFKAYKEDDIKLNPEIIDRVADTNIKIVLNRDNTITFTDLDSDKEIIKERDMWFAWYAFHPKTTLWEKSQ